ncbi:hypothetical protein H0H87_000300 [Tephrocybe sp. NHM501043]|nr:hypothetical protein H0H87_000300 [Tephrocybe sp. NHM501043]
MAEALTSTTGLHNDLVRELQRTVSFVYGDSPCVVQGVDVYVRISVLTSEHFTNSNCRGTGASAIYPLLACSLEPSWKFIATELDPESYTHAEANVRVNRLDDRIRVVKVNEVDASLNDHDADDPHFGFDGLFYEGKCLEEASPSQNPIPNPDSTPKIQFTLCNPPFYSSASDILDSETMKEQGALGACTGAPVEMITPGGEARFVGAMVRESVSRSSSSPGTGTRAVDGKKAKSGVGKRRRLSHRGGDGEEERKGISSSIPVLPISTPMETVSRWYTSMLGKMSSVVEVVDVFKKLGETARLPNPNTTLQRLLPPRNTLHFNITTNLEDSDMEDLECVLRGVEGATVSPDAPTCGGGMAAFVVSVPHDTWSRSARRKRKREIVDADSGEAADLSSGPEALALVCGVVLRRRVGVENHDSEKDTDKKQVEMELAVRWMYGKERSLLESFSSHIARKLNGG